LTTGKWGDQRVYILAHSEEGLNSYLAKEVLRKLIREFPEKRTRPLIRFSFIIGGHEVFSGTISVGIY